MPHLSATPVRSAVKGFVVASLPGLVWLWPDAGKWLVPAAASLMAMWLTTLLFQRIHASYRGHVTGLWIIKGLLALAASIPALLHS